MFSIDWLKLVKRDVPFSVRKSKMVAFVSALISPVVTNYNQFLSFKSTVEFDLKVTGQVRVLRYYLNQRFDLGNDRITITDGNTNETLFIFLESENQPVYLPQFITGSNIDFTVRVPAEYQGLDPQIKGFIDKYKLAGKRYEIIYFSPSNQQNPNQN